MIWICEQKIFRITTARLLWKGKVGELANGDKKISATEEARPCKEETYL